MVRHLDRCIHRQAKKKGLHLPHTYGWNSYHISMSKLVDKWSPTFEKSSRAELERAYHALTTMEVDLEAKLRDVLDVKGKLLFEIELRLKEDKK